MRTRMLWRAMLVWSFALAVACGSSPGTPPHPDGATADLQVDDQRLPDAGSGMDAPDVDAADVDAAPVQPCAVVRFNDLEASTQSVLTVGDVTVEGSGEIFVLKNAGFGVTDHLINAGEWVTISFTSAQRGVSFEVMGMSGPTGQVGDATLEAFDASGASLGVKDIPGARIQDVSSLYSNQPLLSFKVTALQNTGLRIGSVALQCCKRHVQLDQTDDSAASITEGELTITGSANLTRTTGKGLGLVGGDDTLLDGSEWARFALAKPMIRVAFGYGSCTDDYVSINLDLYDAAGTVLDSGSSELSGEDEEELTFSRYQRIDGFRVSAGGDGTGHAIQDVSFWGDCH